MCSVIILAIVCVGVLNAVAFSREMIFSNNNREKASEKAQLVADEIIIALAGISPEDSTALGQIDTKMNNIANDNTAADTQLSTIGKVIRRDKADGFKPPSNDDEMIQYIVDPVKADTDVATDIGVRIDGGSAVATIHTPSIPGWDITVRVYYKQVGNTGDYKVVEVSAFAPRDSVKE